MAGRGKSLVGMLGLMVGLVLASLAPAPAVGTECTTSWTGSAEGSWLVGGNWSSASVPGEADVACIGSGKTVTVTGASKAATVQGEGSLVVGSTLELVSEATESSIGALKLTGGTVTGPATLKIANTLTVEKQSTMSGGGSAVLLPGASANLAAKLKLAKRDLVNEGTFSIGSSSSVEGSEGSDVLNTGTLTLAGGVVSAATVSNEGTIKKTGSTSSGMGPSFTNLGTVEVTGGVLSLTNGTSDSTSDWIATGGGKFNFSSGSGNYSFSGTLSGPVVVEGAGTNVTLEQLDGTAGSIEVSRYGLLTVAGLFPSTLGTLSFGREGYNVAHGTLAGSGQLKIYGQLNAAYESTMSGSGTTTVMAGATAQVSSKTQLSQQHELVNAGTLSLSGSGTLPTAESAEIVNTGTVTRSGTGNNSIGRFKNSGTVQIGEGALSFSSGSSDSESEWHAVGSSEFRFGTEYLMSGTLSGLVVVDGSPAGLILDGVSGKSAKLEVSRYGLVTVAGSPSTLGTLRFGREGYNVAHGSITGAGELRISSALEGAFEGSMSGTGSTVILPTAAGTIDARIQIAKRKIVNEGTLTLQNSGRFEGTETFEAVNAGTTTLKNSSGVSGGTFVNEGVVKKVGTTQGGITPQFLNYGTVEATEGVLSFNNGTSKPTSVMKASAGGKFRLTSGSASNFLLTGTLSGPMQIERASTNVTMEALNAIAADVEVSDYSTLTVSGSSPSTVRSLTFGREGYNEGRGSLTGAGELRVTDSMQANYVSRISGTGSLVLLVNANSSITTLSQMKERRIVNHGTLTLSGSIDLEAGVEFVNYGIFNVSLGGTTPSTAIGGKGTLASSFKNKGTVQRPAGLPLSSIEPPFQNSGAIKGPVKIPRPVTVDSTEQFGKRCQSADPVECATGNFIESQTDVSIGGRGIGLHLIRGYSSQAAAAATSPGPFGYGWTTSFRERLVIAGAGETVTFVRGNGSAVPFSHTSGSAYAGPSWAMETLSGSPEGGFTLLRADQVEMHFTGSGALQSLVDRNGNETTFSYDPGGRLETVTDPGGRQLVFAYNEAGMVKSVEDPMGHVVSYGYEAGNLASVTLPGAAGPRWQYKYDSLHRITSVTDGRGGKTTNEYDTSNRVISQTDPTGRTQTFKYEAFHTTITNKATGAVTDEWFTSQNQPFSVTRGYGTPYATTKSFAYDEAGHLVRVTDGNGHTTTYGYDEDGNRTSEEGPAGETKWTYNGTHDVTSVTKPGGETTTFARDGNGNLESASSPAPGGATQTTTFHHDEHGQLESITDPLERTWSYGYDSFGNRISEVDPLGNERTWTYDEDSRLTSMVSPRGNLEGAEPAEFESSVERDAQGQALKVTDPLGHSTEYSYDGNGNVISKTDARGNTTKYAYNGYDQRVKIEKPSGAVLETGYDGAGLVTSQTDGNKATTTYVRNVLGQPVEVIDPLGRKTTAQFDATGNPVATVDAAERETVFTYDSADRLTKISYSGEGTPGVEFEYDADGNVTAMVDGTGESSYGYDQLGRLTQSENGHGDIVEYQYDIADQLIGLVYPNGKAVSRVYDPAGRLESVTDWLGGTTSFLYDADSNLEQVAFPAGSGNVDEYTYDQASRMASAKFIKGSEALASLALGRDPLGQVEEEIREGLPGSASVDYGYDKDNRLVEAGAAGFEYDNADNLTEGLGSSNSYDAAGQLEAGTGISYAYNALGQRIEADPASGPATGYGYDQAGNLISIERPAEGKSPALAESFSYDGNGLLASETSGMATRHLTWDTSTALPSILSDEANSFIYGANGVPIEQISEEVPTYLHHDHLGSSRLVTDAGGEVSAAISYGPYGGVEGKSGSGSTALGFAGQYTDSASGLQYLRARFYDPSTGQFMSRDPIASLTRAPYVYAGDNPTNMVDPSGLCGIDPGDWLENINPISEENCAYQGAEELNDATGIDLPGILSSPPVVNVVAGGICLAPVSDLVCGAALIYAFATGSADILAEGFETEFCDVPNLAAQGAVNAILLWFSGLASAAGDLAKNAPPAAKSIIQGGPAVAQGGVDAAQSKHGP